MKAVIAYLMQPRTSSGFMHIDLSSGRQCYSPSDKNTGVAVTSIQTFYFAASIIFLDTEENIMKTGTNDKVKNKVHEVNGET